MKKLIVTTAMSVLACLSVSHAHAEFVANKVTGYEVTLVRSTGGSHDFQGWIRLINGDKDAGYIYIQNSLPSPPRVNGPQDGRYVVIDIPVSMLGDTIAMLNSGRDILISYNDEDGAADPFATLNIGGSTGLRAEEADRLSSTMGMPANALKAVR